MDIRVQCETFDVGKNLNDFTGQSDGAGAIVSFSGVVRNNADGSLSKMVIEHYPGMTERAISSIAEEAKKRWKLANLLVIHRFGDLRPGDTIMMVATASAHRKDAFEAAEFLMDYLKSRAPFWKQEISGDAVEWVDSKSQDEDALKRWN